MLEERRGAVALLTLNRPEKRNALGGEMRCAFFGAVGNAARDPEVRAVVITGAGGKAFAAGSDIAEFEARTPVDQYRVQRQPSIYELVERLPKPVIAAIDGWCLGAGLELAMACDVRIASDRSKLGQPEIGLGIIPGGGGTQRLPRIVGVGAALKMILGGDPIDAAEALRLRLVEEVVAAGELLPRAVALAARMAERSPVALAAAKEAVRAALSVPLAEGLVLERGLFNLCFSSEDKAEGVRAFLEKRPPVFRGR